MNLLEEIQSDIIGDVPLSTILRKAKVLAYKLGNQEFKDWVEHELNGYKDKSDLPDYRKIATQSYGNFITPRHKISDVVIPLLNLPERVQEILKDVYLLQGVRELESLLETLNKSKQDRLCSPLPSEFLPLLRGRVFEYAECISAYSAVTRGQISGTIDNIRNRLLTFILELIDMNPVVSLEGLNKKNSIPQEQVSQTFQTVILGHEPRIILAAGSVTQGGNMSTFDQRGQKVNYQYNAAGNINFGDVQNRIDFAGELEKLKAELENASKAGIIDDELKTDAEYHLTKAIQQSKKETPDKSSIIEHLGTVQKVVSTVAGLGGLAATIVKAVELAQHLF